LSQYQLITADERLKEICTRLSDEPVIAVDTEFFWERTYYPILGLIQLATASGECFLLDTVKLQNLKALAPVLENPSSVKILHDAPQDLGILAKATAASPVNIFDTRLAAGFGGFESTCSLQKLLKEVLDIDLPKAETRSNWVKRPLTESQLKYAADDVLHLPELREKLIAGCNKEVALNWMREELKALDSTSIYQERDPKEMFLRVKGSARLNQRELAILRELAAWRENKARWRDLPRNRILRDPTLIDIARKSPNSVQAIKSTNDFPSKMPMGVILEILQTIKAGALCPDEECPETIGIDPEKRAGLKSQTNVLLEQIRIECEKYSVDPAIVASRADVEGFIMNTGTDGDSGRKLNTGWRKEVIAACIQA